MCHSWFSNIHAVLFKWSQNLGQLFLFLLFSSKSTTKNSFYFQSSLIFIYFFIFIVFSFFFSTFSFALCCLYWTIYFSVLHFIHWHNKNGNTISDNSFFVCCKYFFLSFDFYSFMLAEHKNNVKENWKQFRVGTWSLIQRVNKTIATSWPLQISLQIMKKVNCSQVTLYLYAWWYLQSISASYSNNELIEK